MSLADGISKDAEGAYWVRLRFLIVGILIQDAEGPYKVAKENG